MCRGAISVARLAIYKVRQPFLIQGVVGKAIKHGTHILSFFISDKPWDEDRVEKLGKRTDPPSDEESSEMTGP